MGDWYGQYVCGILRGYRFDGGGPAGQPGKRAGWLDDRTNGGAVACTRPGGGAIRHIAKVLLAWFTFRSMRDERKDAIQLAEDCLEATRQAYGENHPRVADVQSRLASLYFDAGPRHMVKPLLEDALKIRRGAFGEQYELTKRAIFNLEQE